MPERKNVRQVPTPEVQGEGSWVRVRRPTVQEIMDHQKREEDPDLPKDLAYEKSVLAAMEYVVGWNWVDEQGNAMSQPGEEKGMHRGLTDEEVTCLLEAVFGSSSKRKNSEGASAT